jgi:hypothetical protein
MEPNKIDNQIKEKLIVREIQPSAQAWDRLDAMLAVSEAKKAKKNHSWLFVAASIVLFFGLGYFLFNSSATTESNNSVPVVTTSNEEIDTIETNKINEIAVENGNPVLVQNENNFSITQANKKSEGTNKLLKKEHVLEEKITPNSQLLASNTQPPAPSIHYPSAEKLLAEAQTTEKVIPSEKKTKSKLRIKIDANSLLESVEKELDNTHKESILDKLSKKIQDAKSAVVNRNYE